MDPYTPGKRAGTRKKTIGLSQKELSKVTGTIASSRRHRQPTDDLDDYLDPQNHLSAQGNAKSHNNSSFIAETSFVHAPLNSRVVSSSHVPKSKGKAKQKQQSLERVPLDIQEALILEDLLFVLMGIEGSYITYHPDYSPEDDDPLQGIRFVVCSSLDSSLSDLVERILPLGMYYTAISSFIEHRSHLEYGLVNHALCAAIREMLRDYQTLLSQLEHAFNTSPTFSLQKLWFYVHPTVHTLSLIYQLILELATADDPGADLSSSSSSEEDPEEAAKNEALGLGKASLKAVLSEIKQGDITPGSSIPVKGGEVLTIIYERMQNMSGDPTASTIYGTLLNKAGRPYVQMLKDWVASGRLVDPHEELLVKESKFIDRGTLEMDYTDEYWERRYTLRDGSTSSGASKRHQAGIPAPRSVGGRLPGGACIPPLLESWKHKILLAGKYLNVIRECGIETPRDQAHSDDEEFSMQDESFYKFVEHAYSHANQTLLQLLLKDQQLIPRLRSLKRYFFLSESSFFTHLLDLSSTELRKSSKSASVAKLQSLLDLALNTDTVGDDALFREDVKVTMAESGLYDFLMKVVTVTGAVKGEEGLQGHGEKEVKKEKEDKKPMQAIDAMMFDYQVKFPLSLVISRKTILRYQLLFRFLLHLKHIEQGLCNMWTEQMTDPWRCAVPGHPEFVGWRLRVCLLRARMLAFVQQILAFVTFEVLEPNWQALEAKLEKVVTVDQLLRDHLDFLDTCLKESMLTSSNLIRALSKSLVACQTFAFYSTSFTKAAHQAIAAGEPESDASKLKRWDILLRFEGNFNRWFDSHLGHVQYNASSDNVSLLPLVVRLNSIKAAYNDKGKY